MIDGINYVLALAHPEFELQKYNVSFYDEDYELIDSFVATTDTIVLPELPEKDGYVATWSGRCFPGEIVYLHGIDNDFYARYEPVRITVNFLDQDGNMLHGPVVKSYYYDYYDYYDFDEWRRIHIPSIPEKDGYIVTNIYGEKSDEVWFDEENGRSYPENSYEYIHSSTTTVNLVVHYREPEVRTAYFYDSDGTLLEDLTIICTETQYGNWNEITLPSIPEKDGLFPLYWDNGDGNQYYANNWSYLELGEVNFTAVYSE